MRNVRYACDVGANDGELISNTLALEEAGWIVLCVEPNPLLAEAGRKRRMLWREVACGSEDVEEAQFDIREGHHTYASESALRHPGGTGTMQNLPILKTVNVKIRRLDRLLEEAGFPRLDVLTVDAEGSEWDIMKGFTVERWKPRVIVLERWAHLPRIDIPGYDVVNRLALDDFYLRTP